MSEITMATDRKNLCAFCGLAEDAVEVGDDPERQGGDEGGCGDR